LAKLVVLDRVLWDVLLIVGLLVVKVDESLDIELADVILGEIITLVTELVCLVVAKETVVVG
jgi:hypothetical protein